ncbi:MAG: NADPH:quinone reductase [Pseudomonadota bacterium]
MKAVWYERNGPADAVLVFGDKPTPKPVKNEVLVKLKTSGVNPSDVKSRAGRPAGYDYKIPHSDGAGVIETVGEGADGSRIGERVWIWNGAWARRDGTCAEYITLPQEQAVKLDDSVSFEIGACLGIPGLTAAHAINRLGEPDGSPILVTGGASSVGYYVIQMAVQKGHTVIATASASKSDVAMRAGAAASVDYQNQDVAQAVLEFTKGAGVKTVIDMDFSTTSHLISTDALSPHSKIICYGSNDMGDLEVPFRDLLFKSIRMDFFLVYEMTQSERQKAVTGLNTFLMSGKIDTRIAETFPLSQTIKAHELVESGSPNGNIVITL